MALNHKELKPGKFYWIWLAEEPEPAQYDGNGKFSRIGCRRSTTIDQTMIGDEIKIGEDYEEFTFGGVYIY